MHLLRVKEEKETSNEWHFSFFFFFHLIPCYVRVNGIHLWDMVSAVTFFLGHFVSL